MLTTAPLLQPQPTLLKEQLTCYMEITDLGKLHWLLGIEIICNQDEHTVSLLQHFYLKFIIFHFNLDELKSEVERGGPRVTLDLEELDLVDVEGVRFLNACESAGVSILHCSPYIREWMLQERSRSKDDPELG